MGRAEDGGLSGDPFGRNKRGDAEYDFCRNALLFLFYVPGVAAQFGAVLLQAKLFTTWLALERVVVKAGFFTDQENRLGLFLAFCHR